VRCVVRTVGFNISATGHQVRQTDSWTLQQLCGVSSVLWGLLLEQQGNMEYILIFGQYCNCAVCRQYCGLYCATCRAYWLLVSIAIVRCPFPTLGLTVREKSTISSEWLLVTIAIVRCAVCTVGLTVSATGQKIRLIEFGHYSNFAVYRLNCAAYC